MDENPFQAPIALDHVATTGGGRILIVKWYEWLVVAMVIAILIALLSPAKQSNCRGRSRNGSPSLAPGSGESVLAK